MFKKPGNSKEGDPLANRLKAIASKPALAESDYSEIAAPKADNRSKREATFKQATLMMSAGERVDVVVKNISETGAKVQFFKHVVLTQKVLMAEPTLRIRKWAEVVWQKDGEAGLRFIEG
jgi:DNA-directed RNA polymerase subunit E'/Rpb7